VMNTYNPRYSQEVEAGGYWVWGQSRQSQWHPHFKQQAGCGGKGRWSQPWGGWCTQEGEAGGWPWAKKKVKPYLKNKAKQSWETSLSACECQKKKIKSWFFEKISKISFWET
jgi:hypothetical protein